MKKIITKQGVNGTFTGTVEVIFNHRTEVKEVHNPSSHDEEKRHIRYSIVKASIAGRLFNSIEFREPNDVEQYAKVMETAVEEQLAKLADEEKKTSAEEILLKRGYL